MSEWTAEREAELRESGWSDAEVRDYKRGWEAAMPEQRSWAPVAPPPPEPPRYVQLAEHFPRNSERGRWQRETFAGHLSQALPPADDAAELAEARALRDDREYRYGNAPDLKVCLAAVRHSGPRGVTLSGTTAEVAGVLRQAGIGVVVAQEYAPAALAGNAKISRV
jgi:hypothetical protein